MDLFKDKAYEELDEISQLIEPYNFQVNEELARFPDEINLGEDFAVRLIKDRYSVSVSDVVQKEANKLGLKNLYKNLRSDYAFCNNFFALEIEEGTSYNPATKEFKGSIRVLKKKIAYEDKEIENMLMSYMRNQFGRLPRPSQLKKGNINEICDLFNVKEALSDRSTKGKLRLLHNKYKELIENRTLNIRDVDLFKRFIDWNCLYIVNGSLPSMSNITKIKIMMRKELPIYSIKEEQV